MRVLKFLLVALTLLMAVGGILFFSARELFLYWGKSSLKDSLRSVVSAGRSGVYAQQCMQRGTSAAAAQDIVIQLRFLSDTEYLIEAICPQYTFDPILIEQKSLPQFVQKAPGSSGFLWGESRSGVVLEVFGDIEDMASSVLVRDLSFIRRSEAMVLDEGVIAVMKTPTDLGFGPVTNCSGYGYSCCDAITQKGVGERITGSLDCKESCYTECVNRPVVLSFTPAPFFTDVQNRVLSVQSGTTVEFRMVADEAGDEAGITATLDFGDGESAMSSDLDKAVSHTYSCGVGTCRYVVQLRLRDRWGVESMPAAVSSMVVQVRGQ